MKFTTLAKFRTPFVTSMLEEVGRSHGLTNIFNPSVVIQGDTIFVAFRAEGRPGERPFRAYFASKDTNDRVALTDLSTIASDIGVVKAADPKLVTLRGELFVTFNTGNVHEGQNDIYLQRVTPTVGTPQRCILEDRRMVEKNWGFYTRPDGELRVLYSLAPSTSLTLTDGDLGSTSTLTFTREQEVAMPARFPRLHIGSQPLIVSDERAIIAANQQLPIPGLPRKIYFGRLAELDTHSGRVIRLSKQGLLHSWHSALPQRDRHNPGLFSATYFAGLTQSEGSLLTSYGVNDKSFGVARLTNDHMWK